jgi:hypothetical protein
MWSVTINTPVGSTRLAIEAARKKFIDMPEAQYAIAAIEEAPTTKKVHLQCAIFLVNKKTLQGLCNLIKAATGITGAHCEISKGSAASNQEYCKKDGLWEERGELPTQGARTDLKDIKDRLVSGATTYEELLLTNPDIIHLYGRVLRQIQDLVSSKKRKLAGTETKGFWYYGKTGTGKSVEAWKQAKAYVNDDLDQIYQYNTEDKGWWQGYAGQKVVIIDELRGSDIKFKNLLTWCDIHPVMVTARNATNQVPLLAERIYITSCMPPEDAYSGMAQTDSIDQLRRRFKVVQFHKFELAGVVTYRQGDITELPARRNRDQNPQFIE